MIHHENYGQRRIVAAPEKDIALRYGTGHARATANEIDKFIDPLSSKLVTQRASNIAILFCELLGISLNFYTLFCGNLISINMSTLLPLDLHFSMGLIFATPSGSCGANINSPLHGRLQSFIEALREVCVRFIDAYYLDSPLRGLHILCTEERGFMPFKTHEITSFCSFGLHIYYLTMPIAACLGITLICKFLVALSLVKGSSSGLEKKFIHKGLNKTILVSNATCMIFFIGWLAYLMVMQMDYNSSSVSSSAATPGFHICILMVTIITNLVVAVVSIEAGKVALPSHQVNNLQELVTVSIINDLKAM